MWVNVSHQLSRVTDELLPEVSCCPVAIRRPGGPTAAFYFNDGINLDEDSALWLKNGRLAACRILCDSTAAGFYHFVT